VSHCFLELVWLYFCMCSAPPSFAIRGRRAKGGTTAGKNNRTSDTSFHSSKAHARAARDCTTPLLSPLVVTLVHGVLILIRRRSPASRCTTSKRALELLGFGLGRLLYFWLSPLPPPLHARPFLSSTRRARSLSRRGDITAAVLVKKHHERVGLSPPPPSSTVIV
jgi:hypothetical protein